MSKSSILEEKPTTPIINILQTEEGAMDFYLRRARRVGELVHQLKPVIYHQSRLGKQHFCWTGVRRYWVWDFAPVRLFINNQKGIGFEVDPSLTVDEALNAFGVYEEALGITRKPLLRLSEEFRLEMAGRKAAEGNERRFPPMKPEEMRRFVLRYCDGHIWTSRDCGNDMGMVFMPIAFGCLSIPDKVHARIYDKLMEDPGPEPETLPQPEEPEIPKAPPKPEEPEYLQPDPEVVTSIRSGIDWQDNDYRDLDVYNADLDKRNTKLREGYEKEMRQWAVQVADWETACSQAETEHAIKLQEWEKENSKFFEKHAKWRVARARWEAVTNGVGLQYLKDFGCAWADSELNHHCGRYINGKPTFTECSLMSLNDFNRAIQAARIEIERRKKIPV